MEGDGVEDFDLLATGNDESFNPIKTVEFAASGSDRRKIPSWRRWRTAHPQFLIQQTLALKNAADGAHGGQILLGKGLAQIVMDDSSAGLTERA